MHMYIKIQLQATVWDISLSRFTISLFMIGIQETNFIPRTIRDGIKVPFNGKDRGWTPENHIYLIRIDFGGFFLVLLFLEAPSFLNYYQNYMVFQPLTTSFSALFYSKKEDFKKGPTSFLSAFFLGAFLVFNHLNRLF